MPFIGIAVWVAIIACIPTRKPDWSRLPSALRGTIFLLALVLTASMMPVDHLPAASAITTLGLGFVSAVFDNIPLTELALKQGGYDWAGSPRQKCQRPKQQQRKKLALRQISKMLRRRIYRPNNLHYDERRIVASQ